MLFDDIRSHAGGSAKYVQENAVLAAVDEMLASQQLQPSPVRPALWPSTPGTQHAQRRLSHQSCSLAPSVCEPAHPNA